MVYLHLHGYTEQVNTQRGYFEPFLLNPLKDRT